MLNKSILGIIMIITLGCGQPNVGQLQEPTHTNSNISTTQKETFIFVAHLEKLEEEGNAALYTGILNKKHGCLYIDDRLIFVTGVYVKWQNKPFWIGNNQGEKFKLGDTVSVGGSETKYSKDLMNNINNPNCVADKVWLTLRIDKPFI